MQPCRLRAAAAHRALLPCPLESPFADRSSAVTWKAAADGAQERTEQHRAPRGERSDARGAAAAGWSGGKHSEKEGKAGGNAGKTPNPILKCYCNFCFGMARNLHE